jgi:hypothetical protein
MDDPGCGNECESGGCDKSAVHLRTPVVGCPPFNAFSLAPVVVSGRKGLR